MRRQFEYYIDNLLANIEGEYVDVVSGNMHRAVSERSDCNQEKSVCCEVMYSRLGKKDEVLYIPPDGKGAHLKIRYYNRGTNNA